MTKKKKKPKWKYKVGDVVEEYLWVIGLALFIGGLIKIFDAISSIVVGIFAFLIGVFIKSRRLK